MRERLAFLFRLLRPYRSIMALAVFLSFAAIGSGMGLMMTSAYLIARAALHPSVAELQTAVVGVRFFGISRAVLRYLERLLSHNVALRLLAQFRLWFFQAVEPLAPGRTAEWRSGDLLSRSVGDVEALQNFYVRLLAPPIVAALVSLLTAGIIAVVSVQAATGVFAAMTLAMTLIPWLTLRSLRGIGARLRELEAQLAVTALDGLQGLSDLLLFGRADDHFARLGSFYDDLVRLKQKQKSSLALHETMIGLLMSLAVLVLFSTVGPLVNAGETSGVTLAVLILAVLAAFEAITPLPLAALHLKEIDRAAERLLRIIQAPTPYDPPDAPAPIDFSLSFEQVTFRYAPDQPAVLTDFSLQVPQGDRLVILGANGAGKSTLIHLLHRFYEVEAGKIRLGGVPIERFSQRQLSEWMAVSPQQVFLFSGTIRENLLIAKPTASEEEMDRVCEAAQLAPWIAALPHGYETAVGEGGLLVSGGERRRLAVARALLKEAPILIFDEPTADVDVETEAALWHTFASLPPDKTVIIMTHRLPSWVRNYFRVFTMPEPIFSSRDVV
ncbi:MAG: thiol reductant ABC exporter subunit CydC [candidate division KSB1 bacterium]|nr:thiol reductant ABC exporter subunit CydC [candidate division KSB1 bacterium]